MEKKSNYITPRGIARLLAEQEQILKIERPEILKVIEWAAALGDRSENADYQYAKRKLRELEKRLRFLRKQIDDAVVVDPTKSKLQTVQFGASVTVEDEEGRSKHYAIVGTDETNADKNYISWKSPMAKAMLGKKVGDYISVHAPSGELELEIVALQYVDLP